eukprot:766991-Hanusia_phi.AAC.6
METWAWRMGRGPGRNAAADRALEATYSMGTIAVEERILYVINHTEQESFDSRKRMRIPYEDEFNNI